MSTPSTSTVSLNLQVEHARGLPMERTPSGNLIISDNTYEPRYKHTLPTCSDESAACRVRNPLNKAQDQWETEEERGLRWLIDSNTSINKEALLSIQDAVNNIFFNGVLSDRVKWEWSHQSDERYKTELVATTALRESTDQYDQYGYETLIVLSKPILTDPAYDRRLILSAFIHELIHCYLFILCGFNARIKGGHTDGFHRIAKVIDKWAGPDKLWLCNMKANLDHFRLDRSRMRDQRHGYEGRTHKSRSESEAVSMGTLERFQRGV
jgi:hypothetical protein